METIANDALIATIDDARGGEVVSLTDRRTGVQVLLETPWAASALASRPVPPTSPAESRDAWFASYAGGWQVLVPHAGPAAEVDGEQHGYHGEGSLVPWVIDGRTPTSVDLHVRLAAAGLHLGRSVFLDGDRLTVSDRLRNDGRRPAQYVYVQHPVFGGPLAEEGVELLVPDGARYTADPSADLGEFEPGSRRPWAGSGLSRVPAPGGRRFGWIDGGTVGRASLVNRRLDLAATLEWNGGDLPYAWFWQELGGSTAPPWLGLERAVAIEPATCATSGPDRVPSELAVGATRTYSVSMALTPTSDLGEVAA